MEALITNLIERIAVAMPELEIVDEDYGQLEMLDQENKDTYPLTFPAVLVEESSITWSNVGNLDQTGTATVRVRLIIDCYDDTHYGSGTTHYAVYRTKFRHELHKVIQGSTGCENSPLIRQTSRFYTTSHGIKVYESTYTCTVSEKVSPELETIPAKPKITVKVQ